LKYTYRFEPPCLLSLVKYCVSCGKENEDQEAFCIACGQRFPDESIPAIQQAVDTAASPPLPPSPRPSRSSTLARVIKWGGVASSFGGLVTLAIITIMEILIFSQLIPLGIPLWFPAIFFGATALAFVISVVRARRIAGIDLNPARFETGRVRLEPGEFVVDFFSPVMRSGVYYGGSSLLGKGTRRSPENTMVLTDRRILLVTAPLPSWGQFVSDEDIDTLDTVFARKEVRDKAGEMVSLLSSGDGVATFQSDFAVRIDEIVKMKFHQLQRSVEFTTSSGLHRRY
jgi:hypothetical protein